MKSNDKKFIYTDMESAPEVLELTKMASGHSTVPMVWEVVVGADLQSPAQNNFIGGCEDLKAHLNDDTDA